MKLKTLIFGLASIIYSNAYSAIYEVTDGNGNVYWPNEGNPGSFKRAVYDASQNPGRDTIRFSFAGNNFTTTQNPIDILAGASDLFIDGVSMIDSNRVTLNYSLNVTASDVDISNVNFVQSNADGSKVLGDRITFTDCSVSATGIGLNVTGSDAEFKNVDVNSVWPGIQVTGNRIDIDGGTYSTTGIGHDCIWIKGGSDHVVANATITSSGQHAISVEGTGGHLIEGCTSTNTSDVSIVLRGTGGNTIRACSTSVSTINGIGLISGSNIVEDCVSFNNDKGGIVVAGGTGSGNIIRNNFVYGNNVVPSTNGAGKPLIEQGGIETDAPNTQIYGNYVYDNGANGIFVTEITGSDAIVRSNIIGRDENGNELGNGWNGIFVWNASGADIDNNVVVNNGFSTGHSSWYMPDRVSGIRLEGVSSGTVSSNFVGTDENRTSVGNSFDGITLYTNSTNVEVTDNVVCNNGFYDFDTNTPHVEWDGNEGGGGIALRTGSGNNVNITSNYIGVHKNNDDGGNSNYGISVEGGANATIGGTDASDGNQIANTKNTPVGNGLGGRGIWLAFSGTNNTSVINNTIFDNGGAGIEIINQANNNIVGGDGDENIIRSNQYGIYVHDNATANTLRFNSFSCNSEGGITLEDGGNNEYGNSGTPKGIYISSDETRPNFISGFAPSAAAVVDIYVMDTSCPLACNDETNQGMTMVATVSSANSASGNGLYAWEYDFVAGGNLVDKTTAIVLATEFGIAGQVNTSEFSVCHLECDTPMNSVINSADFNICPGESATLTANTFGLGVSGYNYNWYLGSIDDANLVHTATDDSVYTTSQDGDYLVVISYVGDPDACADTTSLGTVVAASNPTINVTPSSNALCTGSSVSIDADATGSNLDYSWSPGGQGSAVINVTTGGTYEVTVTNTVTGCESEDDVTITEYLTPQNLTINAPDLTLCPGETAVLTANPTGLSGTDGYTYTWYEGSVDPSNEVSESVNDSTFNTSDEGDYIVVVSNNASGGTCESTSALASVSENENPTVTINSTTPGICTGEDVTLTANATGSNLDYSWSPGGQSVNSITVSTGDNYEVTVTNTVTGCEATESENITENPLPAVNASDINVCQADSGLVSAGISGMNYSWSPSNETEESFYVTTAGQHIVEVTDPSTGCVATDTVDVAVSPEPKPEVTLSFVSDTSLCPTEDDIIEITSVVNANLTGTLTWSEGSVDEESIMVEDSIVYSATFEDSFGCTGSDSVKVVGECIPPDPELPNVINVDNPFTPIGDVTPEQILNGTLVVYNRWGIKMYEETTEDLPEWTGLNLKDEECAGGVYYWIWEFTDNTEEERKYNGFVQLLR